MTDSGESWFQIQVKLSLFHQVAMHSQTAGNSDKTNYKIQV